MAQRVLGYDPDTPGRRLLREGLAGFDLVLRSSKETCLGELRRGKCHALVIGMPVPAEDLAELLLVSKELDEGPAVFFLGASENRPPLGFAKDSDGVSRLALALPGQVRSHQLRNLAARLIETVVELDTPDPEAAVADTLLDGLDRIDLPALLAYLDTESGRWVTPPGRGRPRLEEPVSRVLDLVMGGKLPLEALGEGPTNAGWFYTDDSRSLLEEMDVRSGNEVPLPKAFGLMAIRGEAGDYQAVLLVLGPLEEAEVRGLESLARALGKALARARALQHLSRQAAALRALQETSLVVNATSEPEQLLDQVLELLASVVPYDSAYLVIGNDREIRLRAARGYEAFAGAPAVGQLVRIEDFPNLRRLWSLGRPILVRDTATDPEWIEAGLSTHVRSWLGVPLQRRGEIVGLLSLDSVTAGFFRDFDIETATAFARQVNLALENADRFDRERRTGRQNRLLQDLAATIHSTPDMQGILDHVARSAAEALGMSRAAVVLLSPEQDRVVRMAIYDPGRTINQTAEPWWQGPISSMGLPPAWGRQMTQQTMVVPREALSALGPRYQALGLSSILVAPIRREGSLLGVLALDEPTEERFYADEDLDLATALANHAAIAIHNALSFTELRRQSEELMSLFGLGIALSQEITPEGVVDLLFEQVDRLMDVDSAVVARLQSPDSLYCDVLDAGRRLPALNVPLTGPTLSGHVVRTGQPLLINDYDAEVNNLPVPGLTAGIPTRSWLGVPLIARGETIGAVSVQGESPHRFAANHLRLLQMIANHAAVALDNARLLQTAGHRAEELRLVNEIGRYAVSVLDIQQLSREVAVRILQAFHYYSVQLMLVEEGRLVPQAVARAPGEQTIQVQRSISLREDTIMAAVANTGKPWLVADVGKEPRYLADPELPLTRSELAVPLLIAGEVVGVLDVQSDRESGLTGADLEMLQVLAAQVAISFANARLFAEVRAHAAQLEARVTARTAEIRSQKERTEAILRSVADAVMVLDLDGHLVMTNPVAEGLLEGEHSGDILSQISRLHAQGGVLSEALEVGSMTFQALASPVTLGDLAVGTVIVLRDITRLRELDRLKSQFVATVSHELRTPLANVKLYLSLLRKGREDRREHYLQTLEQETGRLGEMIEDLLDLSRLESKTEIEKREPVELEPLLTELVENHRPAFQAKELDLQFSGSGRVVVSANRNQLIQVFTNLLSNAMRYTPSGGWVRVVLQEPESVDGRSMASVAVQDSGQGIPDEDLPYIFERFYRGALARTSQTPGSGLGLAIVREIVERHGGLVRVSSRLGLGSTFTVLLPLESEGRW